MSDSAVIEKRECPSCAENGGDTSGDNLAVYDDGHTHCFACGYHSAGDQDHTPTRPSAGKGKKDRPMIPGEYRALTKRGITEETCRFFGYQVGEFKGKPVQIATYFDGGLKVAQKLRFANKDMTIRGDPAAMPLFGQHLWRDGGKQVVITEGEIDAMSISQLWRNKWPVVSIQNGSDAAAKCISRAIEWLDKFDRVILAFDMDEAGQKAAKAAAAKLPVGKAFIATLPCKDANEALTGGKTKELIDSLWGAREWRPDGLVSFDDLIEDAMKPVEWGLAWKYPTLNKATYGRRYGEIIGLGAGTGVGKTDVFTEQMEYDVNVLGHRIGGLFLEQKPGETVKRLAGKIAGRRFHVPDDGWTKDELRAALEALRGKGLLYDSFGHADWDTVKSKIRYMVQSEGIRLIYLDHLTALADPSNERESLETIMAEMAGLAQELDIIIHFISHLATPDGKPHEEGGRVTIRNFKGARAIGFWSFFLFGLERDQQSEDEDVRKTTIFRVLKDRNTGSSTGLTFGLRYDEATGTLSEAPIPDPKQKKSPFSDQPVEDGEF